MIRKEAAVSYFRHTDQYIPRWTDALHSIPNSSQFFLSLIPQPVWDHVPIHPSKGLAVPSLENGSYPFRALENRTTLKSQVEDVSQMRLQPGLLKLHPNYEMFEKLVLMAQTAKQAARQTLRVDFRPIRDEMSMKPPIPTHSLIDTGLAERNKAQWVAVYTIEHTVIRVFIPTLFASETN